MVHDSEINIVKMGISRFVGVCFICRVERGEHLFKPWLSERHAIQNVCYRLNDTMRGSSPTYEGKNVK